MNEEEKLKPHFFLSLDEVPDAGAWRQLSGVALSLEQINEIVRIAHDKQFTNEAGVPIPDYGAARQIFMRHNRVVDTDTGYEWQPVKEATDEFVN